MHSFIDQCGQTVTIPGIPKKIISLVPSQTELLHYLNLDKEVIGITKFCIHPSNWFRNKTRIGGTKNIKLEKIRQLKPDLVIANKEENDQQQIEILANEFPMQDAAIFFYHQNLIPLKKNMWLIYKTNYPDAKFC